MTVCSRNQNIRQQNVEEGAIWIGPAVEVDSVCLIQV